jgi:hypothetical protein
MRPSLLLSAGLSLACGQQLPCGSGDLGTRVGAVNRECCDEPSEDCSSGRPAVCNAGCARVLLPFFADCNAALGKQAALFEDVVAQCREAPPQQRQAPLRTIAASWTTGQPPVNQLFTVKEDGSSPRQLLTCTGGGCVQPDWSPDGSQIVFAEQTPTGLHLRLIRPDGTGLRELTSSQGHNDMLPSWLNATHIVWAQTSTSGFVYIGRCLPPGKRDTLSASTIMVMDTRTRVARPLFSPGMRPSNVADTMPSVSPDGKRIAFVTNHTEGAADGDARVWVADISGANARPISPGAKSVDLQGDGCITPISQKVPAWSPDGTQIAHWEGIEMNYLGAFSCQPGHDPKLCRHDPQRDEMITEGNIEQGGDYVGWK